MKSLKTILFFLLLPGLLCGQSFLAHLDPSELNGSVVTPAVGPAGSVVKTGTGTVTFAPGSSGDGVYFQTCCGTADNAYYKWAGTGLANIFDPIAGQISFDIKSRQSFAARTGSRYVFDVQDLLGASRFRFTVQKQSGRLVFDWTGKNIPNGYWYVPVGSEDQWFGNGVKLHVTLVWAGSTFTTTIGARVIAGVYAPTAYTWADTSIFTIGARVASGIGAYSCDDIIDEFTVSGSQVTPPPPPPVTIPPAFTTGDAVSFTGGVDNGFTVAATGTPAPALSESGVLPPGVTFSNTGTLSGIPTSLGVWPVVLTATNSAGSATQNFTLTITPPSSASFNCIAVYNAAANNITIANCTASSLVPASAFSIFPVIIQLSGVAAQWQVDGKKVLLVVGTNP